MALSLDLFSNVQKYCIKRFVKKSMPRFKLSKVPQFTWDFRCFSENTDTCLELLTTLSLFQCVSIIFQEQGGWKGGGSSATPTVVLLGGVLQCRALHKAQFGAADSESDAAIVRKTPRAHKDAVSVSSRKDYSHSPEELPWRLRGKTSGPCYMSS